MKGRPFGNVDLIDLSAGIRLTQMKVTSLSFVGNCAYIGGTAKLGRRRTVTFNAVACDITSPGVDSFSISLSNGYSAMGNLTSGDIVFH